MLILATAASLLFADPDPAAIEWARALDSNCRGCAEAVAEPVEQGLYVLMSFSVPEASWISLSKELEKHGGSFVLRGLPNGSFADLQQRLVALRERGVTAQVQIHPKLFEENQVEQVPAFLFIDEEGGDLLYGNVSLCYALALRRGDA